MTKKLWKVAAAGIAVVAAVWIVGGCGGGGGAGSRLQLFLADDPLDAKEVNITISRVDVHKDGTGWITIRDFTSSPLTINILDYRYDGDSQTPDQYLLADSPLDAGHYTQIRLVLTKIEILDNSDVVHECEMNSQDKTGLKLIGQFDVPQDTKTAVLVDFNAAKSIVAMGNGGFRLQPTVKVVPLQISGVATGTVVFKDASDTEVPVPAGATISAYQGTTLAGSALINEDGSFGILGLIAGDYTLKLETEGYTAQDTSVTVSPGGESSSGTITATAAP
ncbi:MAG: DUF4382 domain-containing protein [Armatimonadetes bacterium]|nr:DUF4382 domain-containing protein [Armatimonadota bacterium]